MKTLSPLLLILLLLACGKEESPNNTADIESAQKVCEIISGTNYDGSGNIIGSAKYFYSNNKLDSSIGYGPSGQVVYANYYKYVSNNERESSFYSNGQKQPGYGWQRVDSYGNVIESKQFDETGTLTSRSQTNYNCN